MLSITASISKDRDPSGTAYNVADSDASDSEVSNSYAIHYKESDFGTFVYNFSIVMPILKDRYSKAFNSNMSVISTPLFPA